MLSNEELNELTLKIINNYNSTDTRNAGILHPGKLFDAIKSGIVASEADTKRKWICKVCESSPIEDKPCTFERDTKKPFRYAVCPFYCDTLPIWEEVKL